MSLEQIVKITLSTTSVGLQAAGFGIPMILSPRPAWVERIRYYTDLAAVGLDFATTTPEYKMATALFAQKNKPSKIAIGRAANKPTQKYTISVAAVSNLTAYKVRVGATTYTYTSDGSATNDEIADGLAALINAGSGDTTTASTPGGAGSHTLVLTANAPGDFDAVEIFDTTLLSIVQDHADPGIAADLDAIKLQDNSWYFILYPFNSKACALVIAAWAEAAEKIYIAQTSDSNNVTLALGGDPTTSTMGQAKTSAYARTALIYHSAPDAFADAAWCGLCAPLDPGSETWKFKTLAGVSAVAMTATHQTNVDAKSGNHYQTIAGVNITAEGVVSAGEFIDVIRFRDWLKARMAERIFAHLAAANKIPYTDEGVAVIQGDVQAQLDEGVLVGGLAASPKPSVTVPTVASANPADKTARLLKNVKFTATLAGAIHKLEITGVIAV